MKLSKLLIYGALLAVASQSSFAQVFRCDAGGGKVTFSDQPCADGSAGKQVQRKRTEQEIMDDQMRADMANERKYRARAAEQGQLASDRQETLMRMNQPAPAPAPLATSQGCKDAQKDYDFAASIRTGSDADRRIRTNAAITKVNAACGSNTPLQQEPKKVIIHNHAPVGGPITCNGNWCTDSQGNVSPRMR